MFGYFLCYFFSYLASNDQSFLSRSLPNNKHRCFPMSLPSNSPLSRPSSFPEYSAYNLETNVWSFLERNQKSFWSRRVLNSLSLRLAKAREAVWKSAGWTRAATWSGLGHDPNSSAELGHVPALGASAPAALSAQVTATYDSQATLLTREGRGLQCLWERWSVTFPIGKYITMYGTDYADTKSRLSA